MRNFSKTLISMAAVMAVGSAMAAGAMAADLTIGKDTLKTDGKISISGVTEGKSQYTLLVVQGTKAEGAEAFTYDATEATIKQIDQNDAGVAFTEAVLGKDLADGSYKVLVGNNDGTVDSGIFDLTSVQPIEIIPGDADLNGKVNGTDVTWIRRFSAGQEKNIGKIGDSYNKWETTGTHAVGDADDNGKVNGTDVTWIRRFSAGQEKNIGKITTPIKVHPEVIAK